MLLCDLTRNAALLTVLIVCFSPAVPIDSSIAAMLVFLLAVAIQPSR